MPGYARLRRASGSRRVTTGSETRAHSQDGRSQAPTLRGPQSPRMERAPLWDLPRTGSVERCRDGLEVRDELVELALRQVVVRRCSEVVGERLDPLFALPASVTEPAG